jgi:polar amino acid transport system substrate-binding protein
MRTDNPGRKGLFAIFFSALLLFAGTAAGVDKIYINGIDARFPPFTYIDRNGNPAGFDVETLNRIAKEMGFQIRHQAIEWSAVKAGLDSGRFNLVASGLTASRERSREMAFTIPYMSINQVILTRSVSHLDIDDIILSRKVGSLIGPFKIRWFKDHGSRDGWDYQIRLEDSTPVTSTAGEEYFVYGVNKKDAELLRILNEGLRKIMASPFWPELIKKYKSDASSGE